MADPKLFAGPRLRRLRVKLGLTQSAMAATLDISPSYLNLLERSQRPVTAQLLIRLAEVHDIDPREVKGEAEGLSLQQMRDVFTDPLLAAELPSDEELVELREATPNVASGILRLYSAYRDAQDQVSRLADYLAADDRGDLPTARMLPKDAVHHFFTSRAWFFENLEELGSRIAKDLGTQNLAADHVALKVEERLRDDFDLRIQYLPANVMVGLRRRLDRHSNRIFISAALPAEARNVEIISSWLQLSQIALLDEAVKGSDLEGDEAQRLVRMDLQYYLALAVLMPMDSFADAAKRADYDIFSLANRYCVQPFVICLRLVALSTNQEDLEDRLCLCVTEEATISMRRASKPFPISEINQAAVMNSGPKTSLPSYLNLTGKT